MAHLASIVVLLHLHFFYISGAGAVNLTIANNCSQTIWAMTADDNTPAVSRTSGSGGDEVRVGSSITIQLSNRWNGRVWGKTGCIFNESGSAASCATGDNKPFTLAEFLLNSTRSLDLYDVSLVDGYNLPLLIQPNGGCESTGCIADVNQRCPPELRTAGGAACRSPCDVFGTPEYCCNSLPSCGPTNYSRLFKEVCPKAYTYPKDGASSVFACSAASRYTITFCPPPYNSDLGIPPAPTPDPSEAIGPTPFEGPPVDDAEENGDGKKRVDGGLIAVSFLLVFIAMTFGLVTFYFHKNRPNSENGAAPKCNRDVENILLQYGSLAPKRYTYSEIEKITNSLRDKLGSGGYGSVYKGRLPDGRHVAVKILVDQNDTDGEEFVNEVVSIGRTYHVNIVSLLGFCYDYVGNKRALVYEFMPNSSLDKYLTNNGCLLDMAKLNKIAVGIAKGLEYLHTGCITRIVHFDIKPQNILLDKGFCPKISDFGLAKLCKTKQSVLSVVGMRGTIGYIAPEVFSRNFGGVSHKSDVYSYGMMLLEMAGAKKGMQAEANHSSENYFPDKIYEQVMLMGVNSNEVMEEGEEGRKKMFLVGFWCIQTSPLDRPSISKVVEMLEGSVDAIQIPPKPFLFSPPLIPDHCTSSSSDYTQTHNSGTVV